MCLEAYIGSDLLKFKHIVSISSGWKIRNIFKPALMVLLSRNSGNFTKVNNVMSNLSIYKNSLFRTCTAGCPYIYIYIYSACGPFPKNKEGIQKFKKQEIQEVLIKMN